ncbi:hypothetical protein, partial [Escherichia coli]|uniref:hypothetical protein n=1 Tax=Escherichia coli TaxID=562 RepID=UPI001AD8BAA7
MVDKFNYLGITLHSSLKWTEHQIEMVGKAKRAWGIIRKPMYKYNCSVEHILKAYDYMVGGILLYGAEIWWREGRTKEMGK